MQAVKPRDFAMQMNLNMDNCWGIVRALVDLCKEKLEADGEYKARPPLPFCCWSTLAWKVVVGGVYCVGLFSQCCADWDAGPLLDREAGSMPRFAS